jgi:threonine dehydratase
MLAWIIRRCTSRLYLRRTPLHRYPALDDLLGTAIYVKHENYQPVGGGSGAAGACIAAKAVNPNIRVIGVQSERATAAYESWRQRKLVEMPNTTFAEGLATATAFELPQSILWQMLDDFVLVSDEAILQAMCWYIERAHTLAEGAGAAPLAAAYQMRGELAGKKVGLILSGGNTSIEHLCTALCV